MNDNELDMAIFDTEDEFSDEDEDDEDVDFEEKLQPERDYKWHRLIPVAISGVVVCCLLGRTAITPSRSANTK